MEITDIEKLLVRYYNGETNEAEEREIKRFFAEERVPSHLLAEKDFFLGLTACQDTELPDGQEDRLCALIDEWDTQKKAKKRTLRLQWIRSIAAGLLILISVGTYFYSTPSVPVDTCKTPEEAYAQTQKALVMLSTSLNKGMERMETLQVTTDKIKENIYEQLNRINYIKQ